MKESKRRAISSLIPDELNANRGTERGLGLLENSLRSYGAGRSVLLDKNGKIIAGNKTVEQALALGFEDVIVVPTNGQQLVAVQRTDLDMDTDPRARELAIADNRVAEVDLEWDPEVLAELGKDINLGQFWNDKELSEILGDLGDGSGGDGPDAQMDAADALQGKWGVKRGQVWEIGKHRLMCGDCRELLPSAGCDLIISDPPYGIAHPTDYKDRGRGNLAECKNYAPVAGDSKPFDPSWLINWPCILWGANHYASRLPDSSGWLVWDKMRPNDLDQSRAELAWSNFIKGCRLFPFLWNGMIREGNDKLEHPTQKPTALMQWCIEQPWTPDGIIGDPYLGSGTTMVAAELAERICYGMEIEPKYVAVALERMADMGLDPKLAE